MTHRGMGIVRTCPALPLRSTIAQVAQAYAQVSDSFHAPNAGGEIGAEKAEIGRFVCQPRHGTETKVDGSGGKLPPFK
ncbi:MAG TPA: hypothetical protein VGI45_07365 [Terracidiphilus sp.]